MLLTQSQRNHGIADRGKRHFPAGCGEWVNLHLPLARQHRTDGPTHGREQQCERTHQLHRAKRMAVGKLGPEENRNTRDAQCQPDQTAARKPVSPEDKSFHHHKPDRRNRYDQRCKSRRHPLHVANLAGTVSVIDEATGTVTATVPVGADPSGVAVDPSAHTAYVTNGNASTVSVISAALPAPVTTVTSSRNPSPAGQNVTFTATVGPADGGTITFSSG